MDKEKTEFKKECYKKAAFEYFKSEEYETFCLSFKQFREMLPKELEMAFLFLIKSQANQLALFGIELGIQTAANEINNFLK